MTELDAILNAVPNDPQTLYVLADYLEEQGDQRQELLRLVHSLTRPTEIHMHDRKQMSICT